MPRRRKQSAAQRQKHKNEYKRRKRTDPEYRRRELDRRLQRYTGDQEFRAAERTRVRLVNSAARLDDRRRRRRPRLQPLASRRDEPGSPREMASHLQFPSIKQEHEDNPSPWMCPVVMVTGEDVDAGTVVLQEDEGRLGSEMLTIVVKTEAEEYAADMNVIKFEGVDERREEAVNFNGYLTNPEQNFIEVELLADDIGEDEAGLLCEECGEDLDRFFKVKVDEVNGGGQSAQACARCGKTLAGAAIYIHRQPGAGRAAVERRDPRAARERGTARLRKPRPRAGATRNAAARKHTCQECGKVFTYHYGLKVHLRTHTGERPFVCKECGKGFTTYSSLKVHCVIHTGEKTQVCTECGKAFKRRSTLKAHCKIHTGEKPHVCTECGKGFIKRCNLKNHVMTHTGEKPFVCEECGKGFLERFYLKIHSRTHTGEKPHVCMECGKGFSRRFDLKVHCRIHTGEKPHVCKDCGKGFSRSITLKKHSVTHCEVELFN